MVWVHFLTKFSYKPTLQTTIDYEAGSYANVPKACADEAIAAEAAVEEKPPSPKAAKAQAKAVADAEDDAEAASSGADVTRA